MKTFIVKATFEYHIERQYYEMACTLRVEAADKKDAIREIKSYFHENFKDCGTFNIIYINEI